MRVRYRPVMHDGPHTAEQQIFLLALAAANVWKRWAGTGSEPSKIQGVDPEFDGAMRELYRQCYQTDVFMGGATSSISSDHSKTGG